MLVVVGLMTIVVLCVCDHESNLRIYLESETYDQELRDVLALQSEVAQSISRRVQVTVSGEEQVRLVAARPVSPDVYESYLKGEFALAKESRAELEPSV